VVLTVVEERMMTILLVEDEDAVRAIARRVLEREGFAVIEAGTAGDALRLAKDHAEPINLMLSDLVMPGMTGAELAVLVRRVRPNVPIIYMSGYSREDVEERVGTMAATGFVSKPFTPRGLVEAVRGALAS
jgi:CheY-like chemotaxis protein